MKSLDELYGNEGLMTRLIECVQQEERDISFSKEAKALISEISDFSKTTKIYKSRSAEYERRNFEKTNPEMSAADLYLYLLERIVSAPTQLHMNAAVVLLLPMLNDILNEEIQ